MDKFGNFSMFLQTLVNPGNSDYELAWREFDRRYRLLIIRKLQSMLKQEAVVYDVFGKFSMRLISNDFHAIRSFKERHSENAFKGFLLQIAHRLALAELADRKRRLASEIPETLPNESVDVEDLEVFYKLVQIARDSFKNTRKKQYEIERDIFVFALRKFSDFSSKEVAQIDLLEIKEGDVDNIVYRLNERLRNNDLNLRDLLE